VQNSVLKVVDNFGRERNLGLLMKHRNQYFMRKIQAVIVSGIAVALFGATLVQQPLFAAEGPNQTRARVRVVHGTAEYSVGGQWQGLRPNMELDAGTQIRTGPDSYVSLNVNGLRSSVKVSQNTTITLSKMDSMGRGADSDSDTSMKLDSGTVLGQVKKLSANSRYEIETPNGVAGIRGTDFVVSVVPQPNGTFLVTFTSVTGTVVASAVVDNTTVVKVLTAGQSWSPGQDVIPTAQQLVDFYQTEIVGLEQIGGGTLILPAPPLVQPFGGNGPPQVGNGSPGLGNSGPTGD
jgi:hypothetical protein